MFSTRKNQNKESDVDKLFNSGKLVSFKTLLECADLSSAYRNNNPKLIGFLLQPQNVEELLNLLMQSDARSIHKTIISLFQTNNTILHRFFADSSDLSQYASQSLQPNRTKNGCYAAGTISRILSRAMDMWPIETHQVFSSSDNLYNTVISNIDQSCIYYTLQDLITSDTHPLDLFMWCLFRSVSGEEFIKNELKGKRPRQCFVIERNYILPDFHKENNESKDETKKLAFNIKFTKSLELLHAFLKKKKTDHRYTDFRNFILKYVIYVFDKDEFIPFHLELAREAGPSDELRKLVIGKLQKLIEAQSTTESVTNADNLFIDRCLSYLTKFTDDILNDEFLNITISLLDERFTQFTLLNLVEFVRRFFSKDRNDLSQARELIDKLIIYSWNVFTSEDEEAVKSAKSASENRLESECLLLQSIILDLWKAAHLPDVQTQSTKEAQYADDFQKNDEDDNQDFMKSQYSTYGGSNNDDDENNEDKTNSKKISDTVVEWGLSDELNQNQNEHFVNDIKIWFNSEYLMSVNDSEPYNNELNLTAPFKNVSEEIIDNVNKYRWGKKFPIIPTTPVPIHEFQRANESSLIHDDTNNQNQNEIDQENNSINNRETDSSQKDEDKNKVDQANDNEEENENEDEADQDNDNKNGNEDGADQANGNGKENKNEDEADQDNDNENGNEDEADQDNDNENGNEDEADQTNGNGKENKNEDEADQDNDNENGNEDEADQTNGNGKENKNEDEAGQANDDDNNNEADQANDNGKENKNEDEAGQANDDDNENGNEDGADQANDNGNENEADQADQANDDEKENKNENEAGQANDNENELEDDEI